MTSGSIVLPNGTTTVAVSTSTPLTELVNYAPVASFLTVMNNLLVTITDISSDPNNTAPSSLWSDAWNYVWNFGDGATTTAHVSTIGNNQTHTYASTGNYTISLALTDQYGLSSINNGNVTALSTPAVSSGGGGGGGGGGYYMYSPQVNGDTNNDGKVDLLDFNMFLTQWGNKGSNLVADFDKNNSVNIFDFNWLMVYWTKK